MLLVAGRVDHKGDETVVLADSVWTWDEALALGPEAFAQAVAAGDRGRRGPRRSGRSARTARRNAPKDGRRPHGGGRDPARSGRWQR